MSRRIHTASDWNKQLKCGFSPIKPSSPPLTALLSKPGNLWPLNLNKKDVVTGDTKAAVLSQSARGTDVIKTPRPKYLPPLDYLELEISEINVNYFLKLKHFQLSRSLPLSLPGEKVCVFMSTHKPESFASRTGPDPVQPTCLNRNHTDPRGPLSGWWIQQDYK